MNILVCVKQVPDPDSGIEVDDAGMACSAGDSYVMNRLDEYAMEEALCICEALDDGTAEAVTVGPERAETAARRALAMGACHAMHVKTDEVKELTAFETASLIAEAARSKQYDLVLAGVMSEDQMAGAVGPMTARLLDMVWATSVVSWEISPDRKTVRVHREGEGGLLEDLRLTLPALLTIQSGSKQPRYPNLTNMLRANKQPLEVIESKDLASPDPREIMNNFSLPKDKGRGVILKGSTRDKARELVKILREGALL